MAFQFNTTPVLSATVGQIYTYLCSAVETHPAATGVSATHHFSVSAVRGPVALDSRFVATSATNATVYISWSPRVSDVVISGGESIALTITAFSTSATYINQELSISAATSVLFGKRTNIGDGTSDGKSDVADFYMRGLGTKG